MSNNAKIIQSFVDFINETKPYHDKLTSVTEENQFFDSMAVKLSESLFWKVKESGTAVDTFFSSGDSGLRSFEVQKLFQYYQSAFPKNTRLPGSIRIDADQITDFASIPNVYSKAGFSGPDVADVLLERGSRNAVIPLVEGHDYFVSHGGIQIAIKQTTDISSNFVPSWAEVRDADIVTVAKANSVSLANDLSNDNSANRQIRKILSDLKLMILYSSSIIPSQSAEIDTSIDSLISTLDNGSLPYNYTTLFDLLNSYNAPIPYGLTAAALLKKISSLTSPLAVNMYSDFDIRESGAAEYSDVVSEYLTVSKIKSTDAAQEGDAWTLTIVDADTALIAVESIIDGYIGSIDLGTAVATKTFSSSTVSFSVSLNKVNPALGYSVLIKNRNRIVISPTAPLETWDIIKINPIAHSRPSFISPNYPYIVSSTGQPFTVSVLDSAIASGTVVIEAISATKFKLTSYGETYNAEVTLGVPFDDGRLAFTIIAGAKFNPEIGDRFEVEIDNELATAVALDLGYGYDFDAYDNQELFYSTSPADPNFQVVVDFRFATRFTDYDLATLGLHLSEDAIAGRQFRLTAKPNLAKPINPAGTDLGAVPAGLQLFYADSFALTYSDDGFLTSSVPIIIPVGTHYDNPALGLSFTIATGTKPFIGAVAETFESGDIFSFAVENKWPVVKDRVGYYAVNGPRIVLHSDSFYDVLPANWQVFCDSAELATVNAQSNVNASTQIDGTPLTLDFAAGEYSLDKLNIGFTVIPNKNGITAGDQFTFTTYRNKQSFLVHGSVSGWKEPAEYGVSYWNGCIGFTIEKPRTKMFLGRNGNLGIGKSWLDGKVTISRLRDDAEKAIYQFKKIVDTWQVTKNGTIVGSLSESFSDRWITINQNGLDLSYFEIHVIQDDFDLWNGHDTIIVKTDSKFRSPKNSDYLLVDKRQSASVGLNIDYNAATTQINSVALGQVAVDPRLISITPGTSNISIGSTSPEVDLLSGWVPLVVKSSPGAFSDGASTLDLFTAASNIFVGRIEQYESWPNQFTFDEDFFNTYLPLNSNVSLVSYGSGFNDMVNVHIAESLKILVDAGSTSLSFSLSDAVNVKIDETYRTSIFNRYSQPVSVKLDDTFDGFLPGYSNVPYDAEFNDGWYDATEPLTDAYHELATLEKLAVLPPALLARKNDLIAMLETYLVGTATNTTYETFLSNVRTVSPAGIAGLRGTTLGIPARGLAFDISIGKDGIDTSKPGTEVATMAISDVMVITVSDLGSRFDEFAFDTTPYDAVTTSSSLVFTSDVPPIPAVLPHTTFELATTPFNMPDGFAQSRTIIVTFNIPASKYSVLDHTAIWYQIPGGSATMAPISKVSQTSFAVSVPNTYIGELKLFAVVGN